MTKLIIIWENGDKSTYKAEDGYQLPEPEKINTSILWNTTDGKIHRIISLKTAREIYMEE
mgnify:CR=1 FL=1